MATLESTIVEKLIGSFRFDTLSGLPSLPTNVMSVMSEIRVELDDRQFRTVEPYDTMWMST